MFNNIYVIHIYNIKLAFFAPRFKILGGVFCVLFCPQPFPQTSE